MAWLLPAGSSSQGIEGGAAKKTKHKEDDAVTTRKLVYQLEARMRAVEHMGDMKMFFPKAHPLVEAGQAQLKIYMETVKKEGAEHQRGPPEIQVFSALLSATESWLAEASCQPGLKRHRGLCNRVLAMMQHAKDASEVSLWLKECTLSPTYDSATIRLTIGVKGHVLVAKGEDAAKKIAEEQSKAFLPDAAADEDMMQRSPLELPKGAEGKLVELAGALGMIWQAWGATRKAGRAPRNQLARALQQK